MGKADLHMHTNSSDGTNTVEEREQQAAEEDYEVIAITDHDIINDDLIPRSYTTDKGVEVITGAEFACEIDGTGIEILGYFLDPEGTEISEILETARDYRTTRMKKLTENVNQEIDEEIIWSDVEDEIGEVAVRPHLAKPLVERGIVEDEQEAFDRFLTSGCEAYVQAEKHDAKDVIDAIHENGGAASLAHPGRDLTEAEAKEKINELIDMGLDAMEGPYTYQHKNQLGYGINFQQWYASELYNELNDEHPSLLLTGGSDCHGNEDPERYLLGQIEHDTEDVDALRESAMDYR